MRSNSWAGNLRYVVALFNLTSQDSTLVDGSVGVVALTLPPFPPPSPPITTDHQHHRHVRIRNEACTTFLYRPVPSCHPPFPHSESLASSSFSTPSSSTFPPPATGERLESIWTLRADWLSSSAGTRPAEQMDSCAKLTPRKPGLCFRTDHGLLLLFLRLLPGFGLMARLFRVVKLFFSVTLHSLLLLPSLCVREREREIWKRGCGED